MRFTPKTDEQLAQEALLLDGVYDFEIIDTSDKPSKKGNDMITLKICVFDKDREERYIFDYIAMGNSFGERKLRHAANACGLMNIYNTGKINAEDFLHKSGILKVAQRKGTPEYPLPKNIVADYLPKDTFAAIKSQPAKDIIDDDIPF